MFYASWNNVNGHELRKSRTGTSGLKVRNAVSQLDHLYQVCCIWQENKNVACGWYWVHAFLPMLCLLLHCNCTRAGALVTKRIQTLAKAYF